MRAAESRRRGGGENLPGETGGVGEGEGGISEGQCGQPGGAVRLPGLAVPP